MSFTEASPDSGNVYLFIRELGVGSFGSTWLAIQNPDADNQGLHVAVKKIHTNLDEDTRLLVDHEIATLQQLTQRSAQCQLYTICMLELYWIGNQPNIVLEYIDGVELNKLLDEIPLRKRQQDNRIMDHLIRGMDAYHRAGIVHQDLKEENIMLDQPTNRYKYIDWGVACLKQECCRDEFCGQYGTRYTEPPSFSARGYKTFQQALAHDMWSLGVVLFDWYAVESMEEAIKLDLWKKSDRYIKKRIATIPNLTARQIIGLLLNKLWRERVMNWERVMISLTGISAFRGSMVNASTQALHDDLHENYSPRDIQLLYTHFLKDREPDLPTLANTILEWNKQRDL